MLLEDIKKEIAAPIDRFNLEVALEKHAFMFMEVTKNIALLRMNTAMMKQDLETTEARLNLQIRQEYEKSGKKSTEAVISSEVKIHKDYLDASDNYLKARCEFDEIDQLREVFMARETVFKLEASLYGAQYWSLSSIDKVPAAAPQSSSTGKFKQRES